MWQLFGCILKDGYLAPAVLFPGPKALCWISSKMCKFCRWGSQNPWLIFFRLWPFCVVIIYLTHMLPAWVLTLTLPMCTSIQNNFWPVLILATFKSILSQSKYFLGPKHFLGGLCHLNPLLRGSNLPSPLTLATIAFTLIMLPAGFYDIHPGHNKMTWD